MDATAWMLVFIMVAWVGFWCMYGWAISAQSQTPILIFPEPDCQTCGYAHKVDELHCCWTCGEQVSEWDGEQITTEGPMDSRVYCGRCAEEAWIPA